MAQDKLLLIDVYALVYRAFFALPPLTTSTGKPISAAYGFQRMLDRVLREEKPTHVVAAFDAGIPAARFVAVPEYKANRPETPDDLRPQFDTVRKILDGYGIPVVEVENEEADDVIATISTQAATRELDTVVVSGDLDLLQLVGAHCTVVVTRRGISEMTRYNADAVRERYGLSPEQLADYRGLKGDPSDNLPGVPGIGEKTAARLIGQFGSLDALLANIDNVTPKRIADLLREHAAKARACRDVSLAKRDLAIVPDWEGWRYREPSKERLADLYTELEFRSLLAKVSTPAFASLAGGNGEVSAPEPKVFELGTYKVLDQTPAIAGALAKAADAHRVALTTVPALSSWRTQTPLALAISWRAREAVVIPIAALTEEPPLHEAFAKLLTGTPRKIVFGAKDLYGWLNARGFEISGVTLDAMLAAGIQDPARGEPSLQAALRGTPGEGVPFPDGAAASSTLFKPGQSIEPVWAAPADALLRAADSLLDSVRQVGMDAVLFEIEQPLAPLLAQMEATGFRLDLDELASIRSSLEATIAQTSADIFRLAGEEFNLNSPKVLGTILFEKLGLPAGAKKKSGYGTGAEVLTPLAAEHEIAAKLLQYREVSKLKSTYVDALPALVDPTTHRLHTTLHQLGAATGRLSSSDPNLQNIPIRSEVGRAIRRAFLSATPGNVLMAVDYSQIELRIFAHMSHDENFIEAFKRGDDIHAFTARAVFGIPEDEKVSAEMRRRAKAINFGILYGISDFGLSQSAGMSRADAKIFIAEYLARFPKVKGFIDSTLERARNDGFVTTLLGRRRYLPDLRSRIYPMRAAAERMAINAPAQGSAADLIKLAMVKVGKLFAQSGVRARLVLQVHDELIFDVPPDEVTSVRAQVKDAMENAMRLEVPLVVDFKVGPSWAAVEILE